MQIVRFIAPYNLDHAFNERGDYDQIEMTLSRVDFGAPVSKVVRLRNDGKSISKDIASKDEAQLFEIFFQQNALRLEGGRRDERTL